jgi:hypothetical protein
MDQRKPTISPPSSASISESLLLFAYLGISALLKLSPDNYEFVTPRELLEQTDSFFQIITTGLRDTGGLSFLS